MSLILSPVGRHRLGGSARVLLAPHLRAPINGVDTTATGNKAGRIWNQIGTGLFSFDGSSWSPITDDLNNGVPVLPADLSNDFTTAIGTIQLTATPANSGKCLNVLPTQWDQTNSVIFRGLGIDLSFSGGQFPQAAAIALQGSSGLSGLTASETLASSAKQLHVSGLYNQVSGSNWQTGTTNYPVLMPITGALDGSNVANNWIAFDDNLQSIGVTQAIHMNNWTGYFVVCPTQASNEHASWPGMFTTSNSAAGWAICAPSTHMSGGALQLPAAAVPRWRLVCSAAKVEIAGPKFVCAPSVVWVSMRFNSGTNSIDYEFGCNDDVATGNIPSNIGGSGIFWNNDFTGTNPAIGISGAAVFSSSPFVGLFKAALIASNGHDSTKTKKVVHALMRAADIVPQQDNDVIVSWGSSGWWGFGCAYPVTGYVGSGDGLPHAGPFGVQGYNQCYMLHFGLKRRCSFVNMGANALLYDAMNNADRIAHIRSFYNPNAKNNIFFCGNYAGGLTNLVQNYFGPFVTALRGSDQPKWKILVGLPINDTEQAADNALLAPLQDPTNQATYNFSAYSAYPDNVTTLKHRPLSAWQNGPFQSHLTPAAVANYQSKPVLNAALA